jgi:three-Cys-motif partner protein
MDTYLEPQDDGLAMRPAGSWAAEKLDYLKRYVDVFTTSMRNMWPARNYVDLLAGPGKNRIRKTGEILLGSPLLALTAKHAFTGYFFVDLSKANAAALQLRCSASPFSRRVRIKHGDCNVLVDDIIAQILSGSTHSLNLAFLDPEGLELSWDTVAKLASLPRMDLIINYPQMGLTRYMRKAFQAPSQTSVDTFFGDRGWRTIYGDWLANKESTSLHWQLIDFYKSRLQACGYSNVFRTDEPGGEPLMRNLARKAPLYRLLFASKHERGHDFWHTITRRDVHGQQLLFRETPLQY